MPELELNEGLSKDDILTELSNEDTSEEKVETLDISDDADKEAEPEDETIKLADEEPSEEEIEEPKEEDLELIVAPRKRDVVEKYPNLFKDFPYLEKAMYREQQYTELIPTIEDAKTLVETAQEYNKLSETLLSGSGKELLNSVKSADPNAFSKLVDNYLPNLREVDNNAFTHVVGNIAKDFILAMDRDANGIAQRGDEAQAKTLKTAALILHQYLFGNAQFVPPQPFAKTEPENKEAQELAEQRNKFNSQRLSSTQSELTTRIDNVLTATINQNIDPSGSMSDYVKRNATRDALNKTKELISKDTRFRAVMDGLWKKVFESDFAPDAVNRIRITYLNQAKTVLNQVVKSTRNEALRGISGRVVKDEEVKNKKGPLPPGRSASTKSGQSAKEIPRGMKTLDFLMQD